MRLLLALVILVTVIGAVVVVRSLSTSPPAEVAESPTPEPSETATPAPQVAQPKPFRVEVLSAKGEAIDGSNMFGRRGERRPPVVRRAPIFAAKALERYLNTAFVTPRTRFTDAALRPLLTDGARRALTAQDRRALGVAGPDILGGKTVSAKARAYVLYRDSRPYLVTLRYRAKMNIIQTDQPQRLLQDGTMVFKRTADGDWRADLIDVRLSLPPRPKPQPAPQPSEETTS